MKKSTFLPVKKMAIVLTVILAGFISFESLKAQTVITSVSIDTQNGSLTYGTAGSVTFQISFTASGTGAGSSDLSINWTAPTGVTTPSLPVHINFSGVPATIPVTITTTSATPAGTTSFTVSSTSGPITSASANFVVGGKPLTITIITGHNREYDGTTVATVDGIPGLSGVVAGDETNVGVGGSPVFAFATASVGTAKPITVTTGYTLTGSASGNYILIQPTALTANITAKALTITGLTGVNKPYDGSTTATTTGTAALSGIIAPDVVTLGGTPVLNFADALVGNAKPITVTGYTISGAASGNYTVTQPAGLTADITGKALTITGLTGVNRVYTGGTTATTTGTAALAGVITGDIVNVTLGGTPVLNFADASVGDGKPITVTGYTISGAASGNYTLTQPAGLTANITPLALTISGLTGVSRPYNGTTGATTLGTAAINGVLAGDVGNVVLDASAALYTFVTAAIGTNKTITVTGYLLTGPASGNYSVGPLTGVTANITAISLTITGAAASPKPYDGTNAAVITGTLNGILVPDVVTLTGTGTFASVNVGAGIAVTSACTLGGADGGNYSIAAQPAGLTANITPKPLTITATGPVKYYGTALTAGSSTTNFTTSAMAGTEAITSVTLHPNAAGLLASTAVGAAYTVTPELPITGSGGFLQSNYTNTYVDYAGTVSPKPITVTPNSGQRKLVGTADPVLTYTYAPALVGSDTFTGALSRATGETVAGSPYAITIGTLTAGPNYSLTLAPATFAITAISEDLITAFNFTFLPNYAEVINQNNGTIAIPVANSANVATLVARFTVSPGAIVRVGSVVQTSGITVNNFTSVVTYVVTGADGLSTKSYNVTVAKNPVVTDKQFLSFSFDAIPGATGVINQTDFTVTVPVPQTYNVTNLVGTFTLSPMAKALVGGVLQSSGVTANNFTAGLTTGFTYTIQAENGSTRNYTIYLVRAAARTEKQLLSFSLPGSEGAIDDVDHSVRLTVPFSYVLTGKAATFTSSFLSTVWIGAAQQTSGVTINDFTLTGMTYTVKAENPAITQDYTLFITRTPVSNAKQMITFQFNGLAAAANGVIDEAAGNIAVTIPFSANKASLVATFTRSPLSTVTINGTIQVSGTTLNNFTADVTYRVTAENGTDFKDYLVHVTQTPASTTAQLLTFNVAVLGGTAIGTVNETAKSVLVEVPYGTNIADLVATFTVSPFATVRIGPAVGGVVQISGISHNDFSGPQAYTVVAENTGFTEVYLVVVRVFPAFVTFSFNDALALPVGIINHTAHTVTVHVPFTVDKTTLKAFFTVSGGATVSIGSTAQTSGVTVNNFTTSQTYTLQVPGGSASNYVVSVVSDAIRTGKQLLTFAFNGLTPACVGVISETLKTVTVTVPFGTNVTAPVATFTLSDLASAKVGTVVQASGTTPNNFTSAVVYTITAEDGLTQTYTVTVIVTPGSAAKDITYFAFEDLNPDVVGVISETNRTITATVPNGTNRAALRAFYTASPLSTVRILGSGGGLQQSGLTVNDFRFQLQYEVTAQDGSFKIYTVSVGESADITPPIVSNATQTASNLPGQFVLVRTNEATGKVYIISDNVSQSTIAELEAAVTAGYGRTVYVSAANTDIPISTANLPDGSYHAYAIDAAGNKSLRGTNLITVLDRIAPTVSVAAQTKSNSLTNVVNVRSSDASSLVYLILEGIPQTSKIQLDAAVVAKKGTKGLVQSAGVDVPLGVYGLFPGNYHAYAVDIPAGNLSAPSTNVVVITEASRLKSILAYSFNGMTPPAIGQIVGTDISVMVRVGIPVTAIRATFTISELSNAYVGTTLQVSNVTENDFTNPVIYKVIAEDGTSFNYTVTVSFNTGVDVSEWFSSIKSYPNPVSDKLTIEMTRPADRIQIINGLGQMMEDIHNPGQTTVEIQTSTWMRGIYFVRYYLDEQYIGIQKLIKD